MRKPTSLLTLSILTLGIGACSSDPPSPSSVRSTITTDLGHILKESAAATDGATSMLPTGTFDLIEKVIGEGGAAAASNLLAPEDPIDEEEGPFDPDAIIEQLTTTIFTDANEVEPGVYAVPADLACTSTDFDDNGNPIETLDPDCVTSWNKVALRIRVADDDDGLTFAIQLGANHDEPLEIGLTHTSLSASVDLDEAEDAAKTIAEAFGEEAPNADLAGKFTGTLNVLGTAKIALGFKIDRALNIAVADEGQSPFGPDAFRLTSAASQVLTLALDGGAQSANLLVNLGETMVRIPGEDGFELDLPGVMFLASATAGQPLVIDSFKLGDRTTTVSKGGQVGLSIDLNPDDGRSLNARITSDASGETLSVTPKLDVRVATNHTVLGSEPAVYDVTRVLLNGSLHSSSATEQLKVVTGTFSIATNPAQYGFSATAGQCVAGEETFDATSDDFYTAWTVGTCQ